MVVDSTVKSGLRITKTRGGFSARVRRFFPNPAGFLGEAYLAALNGSDWISVLLDNGSQAMLHVLTPQSIAGSRMTYAAAWVGYPGPLLHSPDPLFVSQAVELYRASCRASGLVAELVRFDPLDGTHEHFRGLKGVLIDDRRQIAIAGLHADPDIACSNYSAPCRREIRKAVDRGVRVERLVLVEPSMRLFCEAYWRSLDRVGAARRWYFDEATLRALLANPDVEGWWAVTQAEGVLQVHSVVLVLIAGQVAHSLLVGNPSQMRPAGAQDLLTHRVMCAVAARGIRYFCLGGGRTDAPDDSLLRYKAKFCAGGLFPLPQAFILHDSAALPAFSRLYGTGAEATVRHDPLLESLARVLATEQSQT